jgi:hypothetical protein
MSQRSLAAGAISGALSFAACFLPGDHGSTWAPGVIFGALVLAPSFAGWVRRGSLLVASTLIYRAAVWFASTLYLQAAPHFVPSCTLAGGLGALALPLATRALTKQRFDQTATRLGIIAGAVSGSFLDLYLRLLDGRRTLDYAAVAACFVAWQASYAALHKLAPWRAWEEGQ